MSLSQLPTELLEQVLSPLPWYCVLEKSLVSKKWFSIISEWLKRHHGTELMLTTCRESGTRRIRCTLTLSKPVSVDMMFDQCSRLTRLRITNILHQEIATLLTDFRHQLVWLEHLEVEIFPGDMSVGTGPVYVSLPSLRVFRFAAYRKQRDFLWRLAWMYVVKAPKLEKKQIIECSYKKLIFLFVDEPVRDRGLLTKLYSNCIVMVNYLLIVFLFLIWQ